MLLGGSWGSLPVMQNILAALGPGFPHPIVGVLHRHPGSGRTTLDSLARSTSLAVTEPGDHEMLAPGRVYLAPPDYHLLVGKRYLTLSVDPPVCHSRPSIDVLFESASWAFGPRVIAILLSGANRDGAHGMSCVKSRGGICIVQDPADAVCPTMPESALRKGIRDFVLPAAEIPGILQEILSS